MVSTTDNAVLDATGRTMFVCTRCGHPLTQEDFFALGMRLPEAGETRGEYCETELLDSVTHLACVVTCPGEGRG